MIYRAEIVRAVLEENGLNSVIVNKKDQSYQIGQYEVFTLPEDVLKAVKIIQDDVHFD